MEADYNVWFGQRLKLVMEHFGVTAKSLGEHSGVGRMTISRILQGRYATAEEVKKIADAFGISVERLKQKDFDVERAFHKSRDQFDELEHELELVQHFLTQALGRLEIGMTHLWMARVYYNLQNFEKTLEEQLIAFTLLKDCRSPEHAYVAYVTLMGTYLVLGNYDEADKLFIAAEATFKDNALQLAQLAHYKGCILAEYHKDFASAIEYFQKAHTLRQVLGHNSYARRNLANMGDVYFRMHQFEMAKQCYEQCFREYPDCEPNKLIELSQWLDYIKTLICLGELEQARTVLDDHFEEAMKLDYQKVRALYLLLKEVLYADGAAARQILATDDLGNEKISMIATMLLCFAHYKKGETQDMLQVFGKFLADELIFA